MPKIAEKITEKILKILVNKEKHYFFDVLGEKH